MDTSSLVDQSEGRGDLVEENKRLLNELELAYHQMEDYILASKGEVHVAYRELERKNRRLEEQLAQLEEAHRELRAALEEIESTYLVTLDALVSALDLRDTNTYGHSQRVTQYTVTIARKMGVNADELVDIERGALLHDIGKIGVSDTILRKQDKLTQEEWEEMKLHPLLGYKILLGINFLKGASLIVLHHQERYNGSGYPGGLAKDEITPGARIFAVADALDAITSDRPYRRALPYEVAKAEIIKHTGSQFDPSVVEAFLKIPEREWEDIREYVNSLVRGEEHAMPKSLKPRD